MDFTIVAECCIDAATPLMPITSLTIA